MAAVQRLSFFCVFPQHTDHHAFLTPTRLHKPSSLLSSSLGLEQLRNLRHLDVAYNLLEGHTELSPLYLLAELRKVRHECPTGLEATFRSGSPCSFT